MTRQPGMSRAELTFSIRAAMLLDDTLDILAFCDEVGEDGLGGDTKLWCRRRRGRGRGLQLKHLDLEPPSSFSTSTVSLRCFRLQRVLLLRRHRTATSHDDMCSARPERQWRLLNFST